MRGGTLCQGYVAVPPFCIVQAELAAAVRALAFELRGRWPTQSIRAVDFKISLLHGSLEGWAFGHPWHLMRQRLCSEHLRTRK